MSGVAQPLVEDLVVGCGIYTADAAPVAPAARKAKRTPQTLIVASRP